ncbi:hypothetical protein PENDEC_c006G01992 [Penicillium decumbens]|uniref:DNA2/NAM7 helicase-like C-terminal domain-containing protein n=1 Tax=Penicillium decumbens TaxID=69771 RepID=A0A1V6PGK0_PENDC|nr:hypothetical protein PENDEC_c006G01992 [Penicillium decumbens]
MEDNDEDFVEFRYQNSAETRNHNTHTNIWLQSLRTKKRDYFIGQACLVGPADELFGTFRVDTQNPGITWTLAFFHDYEEPFIEFEAEIRTAKEDGEFKSHWPSEEASFRIFREHIEGFEVKEVIMGNSSDKARGPLRSVYDRMTDSNDQEPLVAPASLVENRPAEQEYIQDGKMWCFLVKLTPHSKVEREGPGMFRERDYRGLTDEVNKIRDHLRETETLCMFVRTKRLKSGLEDMIAGLESQADHPYGPFFGEHPTKPFLQVGQINPCPPKAKSQASMAFHSIAEYVVKAGYGTILENALEQQCTGVGKAIQCSLVTVLPPGVTTEGVPNELLGFLTVPEGYSIPQPGETFPLLFPKFHAANHETSRCDDSQEGSSIPQPAKVVGPSEAAPATDDWGSSTTKDDWANSTTTDDWGNRTTTDDVPVEDAEPHGGLTYIEEQLQALDDDEADAYPWESGWRCRVLTPAPFAPVGRVTIHMRRCLDKETNLPIISEESEEPRALTPKTNAAFDLHDALSREQPQDCRIKRISSQKPYKQQISACYGLVYNTSSIHSTLFANNAMDLPEVNIYKSITPENLIQYANRVKTDKTMNQEQLSVFEKFQKLRGWIGCVQGPPGTGKTYTLARCVLPFLLYPKKDANPGESPEEPGPDEIPRAKRSDPARHQVLLLAPTNAAADHLAQSLNDLIQRHSDEFTNGKPKVVRVYPIDAEEDTYCKPGAAIPSMGEEAGTDADVGQALQAEIPSTKIPSTEIPSTKIPSTKIPSTKIPSTEIPSTMIPSIGEEAMTEPAIPSMDEETVTDADVEQALQAEIPSTKIPSTEIPSTEIPSIGEEAVAEPAIPSMDEETVTDGDVGQALQAEIPSMDEETVTDADVEQALQAEIVYKLFWDYYTENKPSRQLTRSSASRITLHELSLGHQIMEFAKNDARWDQWLMQRDDLVVGDLDPEQKSDYLAYGKYMLQQVLADADIVVCTLFSAGQNIIREAINPDAIFVDEAAMTKETDLWPLYTYFNPRDHPLLLFGDHHQLQSIVKSTPDTNQFHRQLQLSPFARFVYAGFLVELLREQHRMVPGISAIVNRVFYANELRDAMQVTLPHRELARKILEWNKDHFACDSNVIFVNVPDSTPWKVGPSTINDKFAEEGITICRDLLYEHIVDPKDIVILTPYEAQYRLYQRLLVQAHVQSPYLGFNNVDVRKVDSFQGQESPVVIFDVTFTEKLGFMSVPNRWNVALSRARDALYVLSDSAGIRKKGGRVYCITQTIKIADEKELWIDSQEQVMAKGKRHAGLAAEKDHEREATETASNTFRKIPIRFIEKPSDQDEASGFMS